jgi:hypothetical protein
VFRLRHARPPSQRGGLFRAWSNGRPSRSQRTDRSPEIRTCASAVVAGNVTGEVAPVVILACVAFTVLCVHQGLRR